MRIHLRVIARAIDGLPSNVSAADREDVEASLVREALKTDAEIVKKLASRIDEIFNPDGDFDEEDRARRRGLVLATTCPTAPWPKSPMTAAQPNGATTG